MYIIIKTKRELQYRKRYELLQRDNFKKEMECFKWLQYRKRYELLQQKN